MKKLNLKKSFVGKTLYKNGRLFMIIQNVCRIPNTNWICLNGEALSTHIPLQIITEAGAHELVNGNEWRAWHSEKMENLKLK